MKIEKEIIEKWERKKQEILENAKSLTAHDLPIKFLYQETHFTTPASNYDMLLKAVERGHGATPKILEKFQISLEELAEYLGVEYDLAKRVLEGNPRASLVMVDGEDAQALRDDVVEEGRKNAIRIFKEADWGDTLRFYRPSGLRLKYCVEDMFTVLLGVAEGEPVDKYPIDGIIFPKIEHPDQIAFVCDILGEIENKIGLKENQIKLEFLVESGWAVMNLPELVKRSIHRLAGIIFGIADFSADVNLPVIENNHPVCDWVRAFVVDMAGTVGVPAIDNMTINYPVADKSLSLEENKKRILERLKEAYEDALHGIYMGMTGKWVGHPLQVYVVKLAFEKSFNEERMNEEIEKIVAYQEAVKKALGATIIKGVMSDRATDRHARRLLREAIARGKLSPDKGKELGVLSEEEYQALISS